MIQDPRRRVLVWQGKARQGKERKGRRHTYLYRNSWSITQRQSDSDHLDFRVFPPSRLTAWFAIQAETVYLRNKRPP